MVAVLQNAKFVDVVVPLCLVMVLAGLSALFYGNLETWFPSHIHAWTQSDRLALAYGFLDNGFNLLLPQTNNIFTPGGITGVDLPIHEYLVAGVMKIVGSRDPLIFRLYTLSYCLLSYGFVYAMTRQYTGSAFKAAVSVVFTFAAPIISYYQFGFIPSMTSLASVLIGMYFFMKYNAGGNRTNLTLAVAFFVLGALPRMSVNLVLISLAGLLSLKWFKARRVNWNELVSIALAFAVVGASLLYKHHLNNEYGSRFLTVLMPAEDNAELRVILHEMWVRWRYQFATQWHWILLAFSASALLIAIMRSKLHLIDRELLLMSGLLFTGSMVFVIALAKQFVAHEYYFLDSLYVATVLFFIAGLKFLRWNGYLANWFWTSVLIGCLAGAAYDSYQVQGEKYSDTEWDRGEVTRKNYSGSDLFLDSIGIPADARMLVLEPYSTNGPLLLMQRKGYTILNSNFSNITRALELPFEYIVCQDVYLPPFVLSGEGLQLTECLERVAGNGRISLFKFVGLDCLEAKPPFRPTAELLGGTGSVSFSSTVNEKDTTGNFNNSGVVLTADRNFGLSFQLDRIDTTSFNRVLAEIQFDTSGVARNIACDIAMSLEGSGGVAFYFKSFRVDVGKLRSDTVQYLFSIPAELPETSLMRCYLWNRYRQDVPLRSLKVEMFKQETS